MDKKRIGVITWGFILVTALIVALMLSGNLRRSTRVTLPDTSGDSAEDGQLPVAGDALTVVEIRPETVQTAIATLHRPESYRRSVTVEYLWDGGSSTLESVVSVREGWTRIDRSLPDGQVRHVLTDGETTYIWYNESAACFTGAAGEITADMEQTIPTYEDVLSLPADTIAQADYRMVSDVRCIYVETAADESGCVQRYWISVDTGLLVVAERLQDDEPVYRMAALTLDAAAPEEESFTLPDGTVLMETENTAG